MNDRNGLSQNYESSGSHSDCEVIVPLLDCYHDNEIDDAERLEVDKHLANCAACNGELANIASLVTKLAALPPVRSEIDFADLVEKQILAEQSVPASPASINSSQNVVPISSAKKWLAAVAAVVVLALIGLQMTNTVRHTVSVASGDLPTPQITAEKTLDLQEQGTTSKPEAAVKTDKPKDVNQISPAHSNRIRTANVKVAEFDGVDVNQKQNLVAISNPVQNNIAEELGITTDEDGLYAIKM
jgi:anti-sigma factor RsiW